MDYSDLLCCAGGFKVFVGLDVANSVIAGEFVLAITTVLSKRSCDLCVGGRYFYRPCVGGRAALPPGLTNLPANALILLPGS